MGAEIPARPRDGRAADNLGRPHPPSGTGTPQSRTGYGKRVPEKMCGVLRPGCAVVSKYEFIESLGLDVVKYAFPVEFMCRHMGVSRSGFYEWRSRPASATAERRDFLGTLIRKSFEDSDETYGHRRVHAELARWGVQCGVELVRAIMRMLELEPCQPRPRRRGLTEQGA